MSIALTGTGGLFTRLGKLGAFLSTLNGWQALTPGLVEALADQYESSLLSVIDGVADLTTSWPNSIESPMRTLLGVAQSTITEMVAADVPNQANSLYAALVELIAQMQAATATVAACGVAIAAAPLDPFTGNGVLCLTTQRGDGLVQQNLVAELVTLQCTADAQTGNARLNQESFGCTAVADAGDPYSYLWPTGSGASAAPKAIDASTYSQSNGNVLYNGDFETWGGQTAGVPNNWIALVGAAATDFQQSTATYFDGASSLELIGASANPASLTQQFSSSTGTTVQLTPQLSYAVNCWIKADVVPAAGVLTIDLIDNSADVIQDSQGNNNSLTIALSSLGGTGWYSLQELIATSVATGSQFFRLPRVLPATIRLRIRVSTAISAGTNIFVDRAAMGAVTALYTGGPGASLFSGNVPFIQGDGWNLTTTNDRASSGFAATFQALFDRLFGMRALGLLLPTGTNTADVQTITSSQTAAETFALTYTFPDGSQVTTANIAYNATAAAVQAALAAAGVPAGSGVGVVCTGSGLPSDSVICTFGGLLSGLQALLTVTTSAGSVTIAHTTSGVPTISDGLITAA